MDCIHAGDGIFHINSRFFSTSVDSNQGLIQEFPAHVLVVWYRVPPELPIIYIVWDTAHCQCWNSEVGMFIPYWHEIPRMNSGINTYKMGRGSNWTSFGVNQCTSEVQNMKMKCRSSIAHNYWAGNWYNEVVFWTRVSVRSVMVRVHIRFLQSVHIFQCAIFYASIIKCAILCYGTVRLSVCLKTPIFAQWLKRFYTYQI